MNLFCFSSGVDVTYMVARAHLCIIYRGNQQQFFLDPFPFVWFSFFPKLFNAANISNCLNSMFAKWVAGCMGSKETEGSDGDRAKEDNPFPEPPIQTP